MWVGVVGRLGVVGRGWRLTVVEPWERWSGVHCSLGVGWELGAGSWDKRPLQRASAGRPIRGDHGRASAPGGSRPASALQNHGWVSAPRSPGLRPLRDTSSTRPLREARAQRPLGEAPARHPLHETAAERPLCEARGSAPLREAAAWRPRLEAEARRPLGGITARHLPREPDPGPLREATAGHLREARTQRRSAKLRPGALTWKPRAGVHFAESQSGTLSERPRTVPAAGPRTRVHRGESTDGSASQKRRTTSPPASHARDRPLRPDRYPGRRWRALSTRDKRVPKRRLAAGSTCSVDRAANRYGGRYWDRTSDLFGVNEALSR